MSRFLVLSVIVASLSTIVGCGAQRDAAVVMSAADSARDEASWTPPDQVAMSFEKSRQAVEKESESTTDSTTTSFRPNRNRPKRGAVHAATY
jgi:hypothetical protein